jgi:hypothetical protein
VYYNWPPVGQFITNNGMAMNAVFPKPVDIHDLLADPSFHTPFFIRHWANLPSNVLQKVEFSDLSITKYTHSNIGLKIH